MAVAGFADPYLLLLGDRDTSYPKL